MSLTHAVAAVLCAAMFNIASARPAPVCAPIEVREVSVAHAVEGRHSVGEAAVFEPGDTVHALAVVKNPGAKAPIEMVWIRDGVVRSRVNLSVGTTKGWRTWSKHTLRGGDVGAWTVEVRAEDGTLLEATHFEVARTLALAP